MYISKITTVAVLIFLVHRSKCGTVARYEKDLSAEPQADGTDLVDLFPNGALTNAAVKRGPRDVDEEEYIEEEPEPEFAEEETEEEPVDEEPEPEHVEEDLEPEHVDEEPGQEHVEEEPEPEYVDEKPTGSEDSDEDVSDSGEEPEPEETDNDKFPSPEDGDEEFSDTDEEPDQDDHDDELSIDDLYELYEPEEIENDLDDGLSLEEWLLGFDPIKEVEIGECEYDDEGNCVHDL